MTLIYIHLTKKLDIPIMICSRFIVQFKEEEEKKKKTKRIIILA